MTTGPAEIAGSTPIRAKKSGENTPSKVPAKQPPKRPIPTMAPTTNGLGEAEVLPPNKINQIDDDSGPDAENRPSEKVRCRAPSSQFLCGWWQQKGRR